MHKIAFISLSDPRDRKNWSGTLYSEYHELKKYFDVVPIIVKFNPLLLFFVKLKERVRYVITGKTYLFEYSSKYMNRNAAVLINKQLETSNFDVLFVASGSSILPFIVTKTPIVYMSDAVFALMKDYYFININPTVEKNGNYFEQKSIDIASAAIFASNWSKQGALDYYGVDADKLYMIPLGANVDIDGIYDIERRVDENIHILFIGVDWKRKGGDIAIQTTYYLNNNLYKKFELDIVGGKPDYEVDERYIHLHGFIDKNTKEGMDEFKSLIKRGHLLFLPTHAECAGIVFSEAGAYSLPIVTYDTGGTTTYVHDGYNGRVLSPGEGSKQFADAIMSIVSTQDIYNQYCRNSRALFLHELNWNVWGERVKKIIDDILG